MKDEEGPAPGVPVGLELCLSDDADGVILRLTLASVPEKGEPVMLVIPPDNAVALALSLLACVKELRSTSELDAMFPPLDPKHGN